MPHTHEHNHHGHAETLTSLNATYYIAIALNAGFVVLEVVMGLLGNSLGLLSDAGHKLIDVFSLVIALLAFKLTKSRPDSHFTYGYRKTSVLISLFNAVILLVAVCIIIWESILKFKNPEPVNGAVISWTAGIGIIVSGVSAILLMKHQKKDINTRGAFLHMATDALVSIGVVIAGIVISATGWTVIDPVISLVIAVIILYNTLRLLSESFRMSIDAVPEGIDYQEVKAAMESVKGVTGVSDLHIWPVSITETALTARVDLKDISSLADVRAALKPFGISEITLEPEMDRE